MLPDPKIFCPATGFAKSCREIITGCDCPKFVTIRGKDPQTGVEADRHGCVDTFLPLLLIENAQMSRQTGAAVESFRNEMAKERNDAWQARQHALSLMSGGQGLPQLNGTSK